MKIKEVSKGMINRSMKGHRLRFLLTEIFLVAILVAYFVGCYAYISNVFIGAVPLDSGKFANEVKMTEVPEAFELHRGDDTQIPSYALKGSSYWQGKRYEFSVRIEDVEKTSMVYRNKDTQTGDEDTAEEISTNIYTADICGKKVLVVAYPHQELKSGQTVEGIFTSLPLIIRHDMARSEEFEIGESVCEYMLDLRGLEMESEIFDVTFCIVMLALVIWLGIKLIRQYKNHLLTPTYRQLDRYGEITDIEKQIETELEANYIKDEDCIITENWILSEDVFKLKVVKNHRRHGNFQYVPQKK